MEMKAGSLIVETRVVGFESPEAASAFSTNASRALPIDEAKYGPCTFHQLPVSVTSKVLATSDLARRAAKALPESGSSASARGGGKEQSVAALREELRGRLLELEEAQRDLAGVQADMGELRGRHSAAAEERDNERAAAAEANRLLATARKDADALKVRAALISPLALL